MTRRGRLEHPRSPGSPARAAPPATAPARLVLPGERPSSSRDPPGQLSASPRTLRAAAPRTRPDGQDNPAPAGPRAALSPQGPGSLGSLRRGSQRKLAGPGARGAPRSSPRPCSRGAAGAALRAPHRAAASGRRAPGGRGEALGATVAKGAPGPPRLCPRRVPAHLPVGSRHRCPRRAPRPLPIPALRPARRRCAARAGRGSPGRAALGWTRRVWRLRSLRTSLARSCAARCSLLGGRRAEPGRLRRGAATPSARPARPAAPGSLPACARCPAGRGPRGAAR